MSIRHVWVLARRELAAFFLTPMGFLSLLGFLAMAWLNFWELLGVLSRTPRIVAGMSDPMSLYIAGSPPFWISILISVPLITMRLFAEEFRSGTIEGLLTVPVTESEVVVAKWLAGVGMYLILLLPFVLYPPFLASQTSYHLDPGPILATASGVTTLGMMFIAVGLFFSVLTRHQVVAAIGTFVTLFAMIFLTLISQRYITLYLPGWSDALQYFSIIQQLQTFGLGLLDLRYILFHLSVSVFMLTLTTQVLRRRRDA